ncbi:MAG: ABC transporter permease subunit [Caldilineaceae bacterium]
MVQIPRDFDDAARVDGANEFQVFTRVILPLAWSGFLTVGLVVALGVWGNLNRLDLHERPQQISRLDQLLRLHHALRCATGDAGAVMMVAPVLCSSSCSSAASSKG